jgi:hypothetical protein
MERTRRVRSPRPFGFTQGKQKAGATGHVNCTEMGSGAAPLQVPGTMR